MPKLRPLRKPEEIAAVPIDRPVAIDLSDEVAVAAEAPEVEKPEPAETGPVEVRVEPEPAPEPEPEEDEPLKKQLDEMKRADEARQRRYTEERAADQARHAAELSRANERVEQSDYDTIVTALSNEQEKADRAQADFEAAATAGDIKAQAEANRRQQAALVKIDRYEEAKVDIETRREQAKTQPVQPAAARLPKAAEDWLAAHPEYRTDTKKNKQIGAAHQFVVDGEGHEPFSPAYFESLETHLGLRRAAAPAAAEQRRSPPVSAPVSRDTPSMSSGRPQRRTVELSPEQRDAARISGVDDLTYAKGVLELERRKKLGMYPDRN